MEGRMKEDGLVPMRMRHERQRPKYNENLVP